MAQKLVQSQQLTQTQTLTPQQLQVVRLLELPVTELEERVQNELLENAALEDFLKENPSRSVLRVQAFRGNQAIPVQGVDVTVSRKLRDGTNYVFYTGTTDESGLVDAIALPAPERQQSVEPGEPHPDAAYQLVARHPEFETVTATVNIFPGIKTVQPVQLQLREE